MRCRGLSSPNLSGNFSQKLKELMPLCSFDYMYFLWASIWVKKILVSEALLMSCALNIMSWWILPVWYCTWGFVLFSKQPELKWAQLCSLLTVFLQSKMVCRTTSESVRSDWNKSLSQEIAYLLVYFPVFLSSVFKAYRYFLTHLNAHCRFREAPPLIQTHEWVRGSERLWGRLSVVVCVVLPDICTVHT